MPLSTSGTIGLTQFSTQIIIDHAFRGVQKTPQEIAGEDVQTAIEQLGLMLSSWANSGTPLWCQTKYLLPLIQGQFELKVPLYVPGVVDILEANLQSCTPLTGTASASQGTAANAFDFNPATACTQVTAGGNIQLQLATAAPVSVLGLMPAVTVLAAAPWDVSFQYSQDGVAWTTFYRNQAFTGTAGTFVWYDEDTIGILPQALYWRILANGTTVLNVAELFFGNTPQEIPIARINKDDYWNLPNKRFQGRPVQYWCDRQVSGPTMWIWPAPALQFVFNQVPILAHRHIMDVGQMTQILEVPQRTYDAVWLSLAERLRLVIPTVDKDATQDIPVLAAQARKLFWSGDIDDSPIRLNIDISPYTR